MPDKQGKHPSSIEYNRRSVLKAGASLGALSMVPTAAGNRGAGKNPDPPSGTGTRFYVSPDGDDSWNGKLPDRRGNGRAGPLGTLEGARDAIRELREDDGGLPDGGVTVYLRGGRYNRTEQSLTLTEEDSGTEESPIVFRPYEDEEVHIVGGRELDGENFQPVSDQAVRDRLPEASRDEVLEYDLAAEGIDEYGEIVTTGFNLPREPPSPEVFVDGESMTLARWPNDGWTYVGEVLNSGGRPRDIKETFTERPLPDEFDEGATFEYYQDRPEQWESYDDVWMDGYWWNNYAKSNLKIEEFDEEAGTITTAQAHHYSVRAWQRYYYYNVLDELDVPGEFYIDREEGTLYLYSPEPVDDATIEISLLEEPLVSMDGVSNVTFEDLTFETSRGSAVEMVDCSHCLVHGCTIEKMGAMGVVVGDSLSTRIGGMNGGTNNGVVDCEIRDTGLGAIKLGGGERASLTPGNNYATDNEIHHFSRIQSTYTPAVWPTGVGSEIAHNHIYNSPHVAILLAGNEHVVEYNDVHDVLRETDDSGAIYMGRNWSEVGNVIRHNYFHQLNNDVGDGQYGVYLDDMQSGTTVENNVFYQVESPFSIGGGRQNSIVNNLMVDCLASIDLDARGLDEDWPHCRPESEGGTGVMIDRLEAVPYDEEPWVSRYPWLSTVLENEPCAPKNNLVACNVTYDSPPPVIADAAREKGSVQDNLWTEREIEFVDGDTEQFALEPDSWVLDERSCFDNLPFAEMEAEQTYPDYAVTPSDIDVWQLEEGRHTIAVDVRNSGRATAPGATVSVTHPASGSTIGEETVGALEPGEAATVSVDWDTGDVESGTEQDVRVVVDEEGAVRELIDDNNTTTTTVAVPAYPVDFQVDPLYGTTVADGTVELTTRVANAGYEAAPETAVALVDVTDGESTELTRLSLPALEAGSSETLTHELDVSGLSSGESRRVKAIVDPDDTIPDRNEGTDETAPTEINVLDPFAADLETTASASAQFGSRDGELVIDAAGVDVWEGADDYGAAYVEAVPADEPATAVVKVVEQENTDGWAKAGIMMRNDVTEAGSSAGYCATMVTAENGFEFEWDSDANGFVNKAVNTGESTRPCWLKLERDGSTFASYYSTDGENWNEIGTARIMGVDDTQDIAVFATSHVGDEQGTTTFENFDVSTE